jgi:hypothetical protein
MKCDFHCHTFFSFDGLSSPEEIVDAAIKKGINCLAITDHDEIEGAKRAERYAKGKPILIIPSIEVKTKEGEILAINVREKIPKKLSAKETIKKIKEKNGFVVLPHPFSFPENFKGKLEEIIDEIDAIEIFNASAFSGNKKAENFAKKYNLPFVVGSDAHSPSFVGKAFFEIEGENLSIEEVLKKIKNKEVRIGKERVEALEKISDHLKRNLAKIKNYARGKKRKI